MADTEESLTIEMVERAATTLVKAYARYLADMKKGAENEDLEIIRDSVIKRFEYTFDSARQLMKRMLAHYFDRHEYQYRKDLYREAMRLQLIENAETWITYTDLRNRSAHDYNVKLTKNLLENMDSFIHDVTDYLERLRAMEKNDPISKDRS